MHKLLEREEATDYMRSRCRITVSRIAKVLCACHEIDFPERKAMNRHDLCVVLDFNFD
jgi:hypothetical protein